ncbi:MAG: AMP-binding protein [Chloroflexota bacterium]|nr:AMP-binding protein [Chloroflexota bacterium]
MNLAELLAIPASMFPDQEILRFEGSSLTYEALTERVSHTAGALAALGVNSGDRVAVLQVNMPSVVEVLFAAASLGAVFVPLNFRARSDELGHMLDVAAPRVLLAGERYLDTALALTAGHGAAPVPIALEDSVPPAGVSSVVSVAGVEVARLDLLRQEADALVPLEVPDEQVAVLMFTSGTTAAAKAVMLAHADLVNFVFETTEPADGSDRGAVLLTAPLYHIAGLTAALSATFAGRRIVLMRQFDAAQWLRLVAQEQISHAFLVPTMLKRVLDCADFVQTDLSSLQVLSYGAAPMPLGVIRHAIESFPRSVQFMNAFGQTETTSTVAVLGPEDHRLEGTPQQIEAKLRRLGSVGRPLPDVEIRIVDDEGQELQPGEVGEVAIRSARQMRGYYQHEEATGATIQDSWLRTRDLGWIDSEGYLFLSGRKSDLIIRGGENIAPEEIELVLMTHPAVEEAAVFGLPDEEWGERVAAVVVCRTGSSLSEEELMEFCRQRIAGFKRPERIFLTAELPRNALGKLLRKELRDSHARTPAMVSRRD